MIVNADKIEVNISYNDKDIKQALLYIINHVYSSWVAFPCFLLVIIGVVFFSLSTGFNNYNYIFILALIFSMLLFYALFYKRPIDSYISFYRKRKGGKFIFNEDGINAIGEGAQSTFIWKVFLKAYDTPSAFIFSDNNRFFYIFPKRCFDSLSDVELLQGLISKKINYLKIFK